MHGAEVTLILQTIANNPAAGLVLSSGARLDRTADEVFSSTHAGTAPVATAEAARAMVLSACGVDLPADQIAAAAFERPALPGFMRLFRIVLPLVLSVIGLGLLIEGALISDAEGALGYIAGASFLALAALSALALSDPVMRFSYRRQLEAQVRENPEDGVHFLKLGASTLIAKRVPGLSGSHLEVPLQNGLTQWLFGIEDASTPEDVRVNGATFRTLLALCTAASASADGRALDPRLQAHLDALESWVAMTVREVQEAAARSGKHRGSSALQMRRMRVQNAAIAGAMYHPLLINWLADQALGVGLIAGAGGRSALPALIRDGVGILRS